jgi:NAD(P)-dependent dehydrogenase (short-subunit alcohol dehydrogenase family)
MAAVGTPRHHGRVSAGAQPHLRRDEAEAGRGEAAVEQRIVLITGASSGIGRETAYRFARSGARLVLTYCKGRTRGEAAERACLRLGARQTLLLPLDVREQPSVRALARRVRGRFGAVDLLVNVAGVGVFSAFRTQSVRDIQRQIRTNLEGLILVTHALLPLVREGIVNVASAAGETAYEKMSVYCATKFGVRGFTQALAQEHPRLRLCCVNPDQTATRLSGYVGRPPAEVAEVIFRAASGKAGCRRGGDVDVWKALGT